VRPCSEAECHDAPRLIGEAVPGEAAAIDDVVVRWEDAVRQPVVAHELPHILDGVQLGAFGRQWQEGNVGRDFERFGHVPSGLIEHRNGVGARGDLAADLGQVHTHRLAVTAGHDQRGAFALGGADGAKDPYRCPAQVFGCYWSGSAPRPAAG